MQAWQFMCRNEFMCKAPSCEKYMVLYFPAKRHRCSSGVAGPRSTMCMRICRQPKETEKTTGEGELLEQGKTGEETGKPTAVEGEPTSPTALPPRPRWARRKFTRIKTGGKPTEPRQNPKKKTVGSPTGAQRSVQRSPDGNPYIGTPTVADGSPTEPEYGSIGVEPRGWVPVGPPIDHPVGSPAEPPVGLL